MAQTLKEDLRTAIIESAKQEFLEKGYKGASMRSIAKKSNMTVGNLYRYFKSKEDINLYIVAPTFKQIDAALKSISNNKMSMETRVFNLKPDINELNKMIDEFANKLVDIYENNKTEFNILILHSRLSEQIIEWFSNIVNSLISKSFVLEGMNNDRDTLARAYAESAYTGIKVLFRDADSESSVLKVLLKTYLRSFIYMLDNDIRKFAQ